MRRSIALGVPLVGPTGIVRARENAPSPSVAEKASAFSARCAPHSLYVRLPESWNGRFMMLGGSCRRGKKRPGRFKRVARC